MSRGFLEKVEKNFTVTEKDAKLLYLDGNHRIFLSNLEMVGDYDIVNILMKDMIIL